MSGVSENAHPTSDAPHPMPHGPQSAPLSTVHFPQLTSSKAHESRPSASSASSCSNPHLSKAHQHIHTPLSTVHSPQSTVHGSRLTSYVLLITLLTLGCITPPRNAILIDVPFIPQAQTNHCGVVSLAMAFDHFSVPYTLDSLTAKAFIPFLNGSSFQLLADTADQYGLTVTRHDADPSALHAMLSEKDLPIIYLAPTKGEPAGHFALVTGISDNLRRIRIHGTSKPNCWIRLSRLRPHATGDAFPVLCLRRAPPRQATESILRQYQGNPDAGEP
jgi:hypothetical protein